MSTEASTRAEALSELAAIRAAKPLYKQSKAAKAAEAAEAARLAEAKAAAEARAALPKVTEAETTAKAAPLSWGKINGREYARAEAAQFWAEQRQLDRAARAAARAAQRRQELSIYSAGLVLDGMTEAELAEAAAKAAKAAAKADTKAEARALRAAPEAAEQYAELTARAEAAGVTVEDVLDTDSQDLLLSLTGRDETFGAAPEAGAYSTMSPKSYALFRDWTKARLAAPEAAAGRQAVKALGLTAQAVVTVKYGSPVLTVSELASVPNLAIAEARAKWCKGHAKAAKAKAEASFKAAESKAVTREKLAKAEAEAGKLAKLAAKAEAAAARAELQLAAAKVAEATPGKVGAFIAIPVAKLAAADAAKAAELADVRHAVGRMPSTFAHKGPSAKAAPKKTDNTAAIAIANVLGQTAEAEAEAAAAFAASVLARMAELAETAKAARLEAAEATRAAHKARAAAALRIKRRAAKNK